MELNGVKRISYFEKQDFKSNRTKKLFKFFLILLFFLIIFLILYLLFEEKIFKKERVVELMIETPEEVFVGQEFETKIFIINKENSDLVNSEMTINFPPNFFYLSSFPNCYQISDYYCLIKIPKVLKGEKKEITISGKIFGSVNEKKVFDAILDFQLENFSSWFKKEANKEINLLSSISDLEINTPDSLLINEEGEFRIKFFNRLPSSLKTKLIISYPSDFNFTFSNFEFAEEENKKILVFDLEGNEEKNIDFKGFFLNPEEKKIDVKIGILDQNESFFLQQEKEILVKINQPDLVLGLTVNNSFLEEISSNFGDEINVKIHYKNIGQEKIIDPVIKLKIEPSFAIDLKKGTDDFWEWSFKEEVIKENKWEIKENENTAQIVFSSPKISEIGAGEEGEIKIPLKIKNYEEIAKLRITNLKINLSSEIEAKIFRQQIFVFNLKSNEINLKINSKVKLQVEIRYFSDEGLKIGDGPLPPKVGETTSYFVFFQLFNTTNEIKNVKIETRLPEKVTWLGEEKTSTGNLFFDSFSRKITWQIDLVAPYSGGPYTFLEASFKIGLTPSEEDRGKILTLLEKITLEAEDSFTGAKIYLESPALDTDLKFDDWARGKGTVE